MKEVRFYLLSLKKTGPQAPALLWWGPDRKGYTQALDDAGLYTSEEGIQIILDGLVPRGGFLARTAVLVAEHHEVIQGLVAPRVIPNSRHNLEALDVLEEWEAYHGKS